MATFIGQLIGFAVIVFLVWKYAVPPMRKLMKDQQESVRAQLEDSAAAAKKLAEADKAHIKALDEAKAEAARVIEEARIDAEHIVEQLRAQADAEVERIKVQGAQQVQLLRQQLIRELRQTLGSESVHRADQLVRAHVSDPAAQSATVDRFLNELDDMAPSEAVVQNAAAAKLRSASRESLSAVVDRFDEVSADMTAPELATLADDLAAVTKLLAVETALNRHLAEPADDSAPKDRLLDSLLADRIGGPALDVVKTAVSQRWSTESNLVDALEHVARLALLVRADRDNEIEEVEDQLFRFGRILDSQPRLTALLSDYTTPTAGRMALLDNVLEAAGPGVNDTAAALLSQTIELLRGERADEAVLDVARLAVARRGEIVAHVNSAAELSDEQRTRLTELLARVYGHPVSVQLHVDPELLGGLSIAVGDEVIDGSIASRLTAARTRLPD